MTNWFVYQPSGNPLGPVSTDLLARGIFTGRVPRDAQVAALGESRWTPVMAVSEIAEMLRSLESGGATPAPAPVRPTAAASQAGSTALAAFAPLTVADAKPEPKREEKKAPPLDAKYRKLPYFIFGACAFVAVLLVIVSRVRSSEAPSEQLGNPGAAQEHTT